VNRRRLAAVIAFMAFIAVAVSCRTSRPPREPAKTPEGALVELAPEAFPSFADDLGYEGLDVAIGHSLAWAKRVRAADPGRLVHYGRERVPIGALVATLERFRALLAQKLPPAALDAAIRREFRVFRSTGNGEGEVLVTGYYLPELRGDLGRGGPFQTPLHRAPDDIVVARAKDFPQLSEDLVGRVEQGRFVPYATRSQIARGALDGKGFELLWVDSPVDAFFLEIQGSGIVRLRDGTSRVVTYGGRNGHRYTAIGNELVRRGAIAREALSMQSIRAWLAANPDATAEVLATNPSYVFFRVADAATGSLGVPVTADRSIAADGKVFPKGALAFLETERPVAAEAAPDPENPPFRAFGRFVLDQDSGGAIKAAARVDLFFGAGEYATYAAGRMKQPGRLHYLLLREPGSPDSDRPEPFDRLRAGGVDRAPAQPR
jgi:membrane-bound lytic murein transglycosylase A